MASRGRVLIIVENLPVPFDRRVWLEALTLSRAGCEVSVVCPKGKGFEASRECLEGVAIYRHGLPLEADSPLGYLREYGHALWAEWSLARAIWRDRGFDVVHICNPPDLLFLVACWFKLVGRVKVVFDQHDISPELYEAKYDRRGFFFHMLGLMERLTYMTSDFVIATNESYREIATTRGRKPAERVFVVRSGPDLERFHPVPPNERYRDGFRYLVGYVGTMGEQEGIDLLLAVVRDIVFRLGRKDVRFMLVGGGPALDHLRVLAADLGVDQWVEFTGRVSLEDLLERLSTCDLCVNPEPKNPFNDSSTMNKILDYMALGKAIVQFDLREGRRSAGEASLYARPNDVGDFADSIVTLLDDPGRRARMGQAGLERMRRELDWTHHAPSLLSAYERVLG